MARSIGDDIAVTVGVRKGIEFARKPGILADCRTIIVKRERLEAIERERERGRERGRVRARARFVGSCCYMSHI